MQWFWELNDARPPNTGSPAPLSYGEIYAWAVLTQSNPTPNEIKLIKMMDIALIVEWQKVSKND